MGLNINLSPYRFNKASLERGTCSMIKYYHRHVYRVYMSTRYTKYRIVVVGDLYNRLVHLFRIGRDSVLYIGSHAVTTDASLTDGESWFMQPTVFASMFIPTGFFEMDDLESFKSWSIDITNYNDNGNNVVVKLGDIISDGHTKMNTNDLFEVISRYCFDRYGYVIPDWLYRFAGYLTDAECPVISSTEK